MVKKLLNFIIVGFTALILIFGLLFTVPRLFNVAPYIILSGSMMPKIGVGDVVFVNKGDRNVVINDIVMYEDAGYSDTYVLHRIVDKLETGSYVTKGDANDVIDLSPVTSDRIIGTYAFHIPKMGFVLDKKVSLLFLYLALNLLEYAVSDNKENKENIEAEKTEEKE